MRYCTYILYSESKDKYYVGYTANIESRLEKHNSGGTASTRSGRPWKIVYKECFDNKTDAIKRENAIKKKKSRKFIEYLINTVT